MAIMSRKVSMKISEGEPLKGLGQWYASQCDGMWEHRRGINIRTVDNPGWLVSIELRGTPSEGGVLTELEVQNGENDWMRCFIKDGQFIGAGDPAKLPAILEYFLNFVSMK